MHCRNGLPIGFASEPVPNRTICRLNVDQFADAVAEDALTPISGLDRHLAQNRSELVASMRRLVNALGNEVDKPEFS